MAAALLAGLAAKMHQCHVGANSRSCRALAETTVPGVIVELCREEYARSDDPRVGARLADGLRRNGDPRRAHELATALLASAARSDALWVLGRVAAEEGRMNDAQARFRDAAALHDREGDARAAAMDWMSLSGALQSLGAYTDALDAARRSQALAQTSGARRTEALAHLVAGRTLSEIGHWAGAAAELARATELLRETDDRYWAIYDQGNMAQEAGNFHRAEVYFKQALALAGNRTVLRVASHLDLADVQTEIGRYEEAADHLRLVQELEHSEGKRWPQLGLRGRLSAKRGELALARSLLAEAWSQANSEEFAETYALEVELARVERRRGDLAASETWARRAIDRLAAQERTRPPLMFRSLLSVRYRAAHEVLFALLASMGQTDRAVIALNAWRTALQIAQLSPEATKGDDLRTVTNEVARLEHLLRALRSRKRDEVRTTQAARQDLLALVLAEGELWRIVLLGGAARIDKLGAIDAERQHDLAAFRTAPADREAAARIGEWLLPPELATATPRVLHLLVDELLSPLPLEAARNLRGAPLIALRPVVRSQRVPSGSCYDPPPAPRVQLIADSLSNLPHARAEAERLAAQLEVTASVGVQATSKTVLKAAEGDLLHLATHGEVTAEGGVLRLADGPLAAIDLAVASSAPARVVLATCASAAADPGYHSLAAGYLAAGARQVVATQRPVTDAGAAQIIATLYREGVPRDLPRALAAALAAYVDTDNRDWPSFAVFGEETCAPSSKSP